ncbi:hypothetical protein EGW08_005184 [Elysia chlorotica]|uniref:Vesicular, overexpressed in cancer, prosurvival protein 1 n=1 Tax=Elysia chlorotica TaxID=188477 RepID=A0A3S1AAU6_ELYCH|nr:hypothetical protein EGW08_005184 [Elysia chlorotica]
MSVYSPSHNLTFGTAAELIHSNIARIISSFENQHRVFQSVPGSFGGRKDRSGDDHHNKYWYQLWYFWLIVSLFLIGVLLLVFIYCKQQAKQARLEGIGQIRAQMVLPPAYDEPVHLPPPYSVAAAVPDCVQPGRLSHHCQHTSFGYIPHSCVISNERAESAPPPYSPPPYVAREDAPHNDQTGSGDNTSVRSGTSTPGSSTARPSGGLNLERQTIAQTNHANLPQQYTCSRTSGAISDDFQDRDSVGEQSCYHNYNSMRQTSATDTSNSAFSLSQSQLSINLRRSSGGVIQNLGRQPYQHSANMICRTYNDSESDRTGACSVPSSNQYQPLEISTLSCSPSASSRLCAATLVNTSQNDRIGLRNSVSSDHSRLMTSLSYNMSGTAAAASASHNLYRRNAPVSGKTQNKLSTSILGNDSHVTDSMANPSTLASSANSSRTTLSTGRFPNT